MKDYSILHISSFESHPTESFKDRAQLWLYLKYTVCFGLCYWNNANLTEYFNNIKTGMTSTECTNCLPLAWIIEDGMTVGFAAKSGIPFIFLRLFHRICCIAYNMYFR